MPACAQPGALTQRLGLLLPSRTWGCGLLLIAMPLNASSTFPHLGVRTPQYVFISAAGKGTEVLSSQEPLLPNP